MLTWNALCVQNKLLDKLREDLDRERADVAGEEAKIAAHWKEAEERFEKYKEAETKKLRRERKEQVAARRPRAPPHHHPTTLHNQRSETRPAC